MVNFQFLNKGGLFVAYKGGDIESELDEALSELPVLSGRLFRRIDILLPISSKKRELIVFKKLKGV
jgi:16S rRNA (guanine527-N7)-methyltransferase